MLTEAQFRFGDVFPPDDPVSEWLVAISMAANDLIAVHILMNESDDDALRWYFFRVAAGHFHEIGKRLDETAAVPEVTAFVAALPADVQAKYRAVIDLYRERRPILSKIRNGVFHYPRRDLSEVLTAVTNDPTKVRMGLMKDVRFEYADEMSAQLAARWAGGETEYMKLQDVIREGIQDFMRFMNAALDQHFIRRRQAGAKIIVR